MRLFRGIFIIPLLFLVLTSFHISDQRKEAKERSLIDEGFALTLINGKVYFAKFVV